MLYLSRIPRRPLDRFVEAVWYCENDPRPLALERVLPSGKAQLIVNLAEDQTRLYRTDSLGGPSVETCSGTVLSGPHSQFSIIDTAEQERVAGVSFRPGGLAAFFRTPAHELLNAAIPLDAISAAAAVEIREKLLAAVDPESKLNVLED